MLKKKLSEYEHRFPALESQNLIYRQTIELKEKENKALYEEVKSIEKLWQNQAREPYKYTAKPIVQALQLKSLNELGNYLIKAARIGHTLHHKQKVDAKTITELNDTHKNFQLVLLHEMKED